MASTTFVDQVTPIVASWLNDVNITTYTTVPALQTKTANLPTVSAFAGTMMDDVDAAAVRTTIGAQVAGSYVTAGANSNITSLTGLTSAVKDVRQLQPITASIASNAITITPSALALEFRNTSLTDGAVTFVQGTPTPLVIAATDSFGLVTAYGNQRLAVLAINNAGTIELAVTALYGGNSLDETGVITTATSSTTAAGIKAAAVRTGVAYRIIGFVDATFTTAVGWGSLALVQGAGGNAATSLGSLGYGQTWQNVVGSRAIGTTYYNTTSRPIVVLVTAFCTINSTSGLQLTVGGVLLSEVAASENNGALYQAARHGITAIVPPGQSYVATAASAALNIGQWVELR